MAEGKMDTKTQKLWRVNKYVWLSLLLALLYLPFAATQKVITVPVWAACLVLALGITDGAARSYIAFRHGGTLPKNLTWPFTFCEILIISVAVAITGGIESDLWPFYFVVMVFETIHSTDQEKRLIVFNV